MTPLPNELVDKVIDNLCDECSTLKVCALISKSWLPRSRFYLFRPEDLQRAARSGNMAVMRLLLARDDVEVNAKEAEGWTALALSAHEGHEGVVKLLLEREDVEINVTNDLGRTALAIAAFKGHEKVVKLLLARKCLDEVWVLLRCRNLH